MEYCLNSFKTHLNGKQIVARKLEAILTPLPQKPPPPKNSHWEHNRHHKPPSEFK